MPSKLHFPPNQPVIISLLDPNGEWDDDLRLGRYETTAGQKFTLPRDAVVKLNEIDPAPGEEIGICRYTGKKTGWAVWLTTSSEKDRAISEMDHSELAEALQASIEQANNGKPAKGPVTPIRRKPAGRVDDQPRLFDKGTGTDGPAPAIQPAVPLPALKRPPDVIPWNVAFREVAKFVSAELAVCNLQWSDEAQQAAVCTVLIAEVKKGRIGLWER